MEDDILSFAFYSGVGRTARNKKKRIVFPRNIISYN